MRKTLMLAGILFAILTMTAPIVSAQTALSAGCTAANSTETTFPVNSSATFSEGEVVAFVVDGPGQFTIQVNGTTIMNAASTGSTTSYTVVADGTVSINITLVDGTPNSSVTIECDGDAPDYPEGTICHYPPGNPDAAHTITVGSDNAVQTHINNHGDTLGPCPEGTQTRADLPDVNITIFVIFATDSIQVYGNCDDECQEVMNVPIILIIDLDLVVIYTGGDDDQDDDNDDDPPGEFMDVENPEDYGFVLDEVNQDGMYVVIYYLHPDPENSSVGVFQINVYENGTLVDDSILVFITVGGDIVQWTDQGYWDEQLAESLDN